MASGKRKSVIQLLLQFTSLSDYAECLKRVTFVVFLFQVTENCKPALSGKTDSTGLRAAIQECRVEFLQLRFYSPDLTPLDFLLFPRINRDLSDGHFDSDDDVTAVKIPPD